MWPRKDYETYDTRKNTVGDFDWILTDIDRLVESTATDSRVQRLDLAAAFGGTILGTITT
jgi:hypothetical protein